MNRKRGFFQSSLAINGVVFHQQFDNAAMTDGDIDQILEAAERTVRSLPDLKTYEVNPVAAMMFQAA